MGANAQTTVPTFTAGQVLTAAQLNTSARTGVPVFANTTDRDAAFGGSGEKTLAEGQLCYLEDTNKVQYYDGSAWANLGSMTNVAAFTASGTWTVPAGVTYAIAHIRGGGGGISLRDRGTPTVAAGNGGTSSVAFAGGTVSAAGGLANTSNIQCSGVGTVDNCQAGVTNSGQGAMTPYQGGDATTGGIGALFAQSGGYVVAGAAVTPAASITITVGAGGTAGSGASTVGAAGGSGYIWIEYQV
jgi:hypothetical protein